MKNITALLAIVALCMMAGNLSALTNTWNGSSSVSWTVATNWSLGHVPTAVEDVVIPSTPANQPTLSGAAGVCQNLTVNSGATLTISATTVNNGTLTASGNATMNGALSIGGALTKTGKLVAVNITWGAASSISGYINSAIELSGNWEFSTGSAISMGSCGVIFTGAANTEIISKSINSSFSGVSISKASGNTVSVSNTSTASLKFSGILTINTGSSFLGGANITTIFYSNISNTGHFSFSAGTASFEKSSGTQAIQVNSGDLFNNLEINSGGTVTINNYLQVLNDVTITAGTFDPQGNTIVVLGDWFNTVGTAGFTEGTSRVVFSGGNYHQYCTNETFNILEVHKAIGGAFRVSGTAVTCARYDWTAGSVDVLSNGTFTANDLADNGIYGGWYVNPGSTINLYQDAGQFVDLNGSLTFTGGGDINVYGGSAISVWAAGDDASVTMNGGILDFKNQGIKLLAAVPYTLTTAITGGTIRTSGDFYCNRGTFNPTGGSLELYGPSNVDLTVSAGSLWNLNVDKTVAQTVSLASNLNVNGSVYVQNATFTALNKVITVANVVSLNWDGVLLLGAGSQLKMASGKYLYVNNGGTLKTEGTPADMVNITHSAGYYYILVQSNGTISARHTYFQYLFNINFQNGSFLDPLNAFYKCTFTNSNAASNAVLIMGTTQDISIHEADFPTMLSAHTVYKPNNAGRVTFKDATGAFAGAAFESDPYNRVDWRASTPGLWTGELSTDWFTAQNWDDAVVPTTATHVTIPAGAPNYPVLTAAETYCNNLIIQTGGDLTLGPGNLNVAGDLTIHGHISMSSLTTDILVEGSVFWESGSTATVTAGNFHVKTDWEFRNGSQANLTFGTAYFEGPGTAYVRSFEANSSFSSLYNNKPSGSLYLSNTSTDTLKINRTLCVPLYNSSFFSNSTVPILIRENLWATGPVYCSQGTIIFKGASSAIMLLSGGYLNHVIFNTVGNVTLNDSIVVNGNLTIQSGALLPDGHPVHVKGNWINNVGTAGFVEGTGRVVFEGPASSDILTDETFYNLNIEKTYVGFDGVEFSDSLSVKGDLLVKTGTFEMNSTGRLHVGNTVRIMSGAGLNANDSDVEIYSEEDWIDNNLTATTMTGFSAGTGSVVHFLGKPTNIQTIYEKCTFNDVVVANTGSYCRPDADEMLCKNLTISSGTFRVFTKTVRISENLTIGAGTLRMDQGLDFIQVGGMVNWLPGSNALITNGTISAGSGWTFQNGTNAVLGGSNTVIFNQAGTSMIRNDDADASFASLEMAKPAGPEADTYLDPASADTVRVMGYLNVWDGNQFHVQDSKLLVQGALDIKNTAEMMVVSGSVVNRNSSFVLNGKLSMGNGNVLLKGSFELAPTGVLAIVAAVFTVDAPASATYNKIKGVFNMNSGTFEAVRTGIEIASTAWTNIASGTIITGYGFTAVTPNTFHPLGGTVKFNYTDPNYTGIMCTGGNFFRNLEINGLCVMAGDLTVKDDLFITSSGSLDSDIYDITIEGDWINDAWSVGFEPHNNLVTFTGPNDADIMTSENFYNLVIMKTNANITALETTYAKTISVFNDLTITDGCFEINTGSSLSVANDLIIASGAGLNADDQSVKITISGDWTNYNVTKTGDEVSFTPGDYSQVSFVSGNDSYLTTSGPQEEFNHLRIQKPGFAFRSNDNIHCNGNLLIDEGNWEDNIPGLYHKVNGSFTVNASAALINAAAQNTFEFSGGPASINYHSTTGCFHDVIINKFSYYYMDLNTNLNCLFNGNLTIQGGTLYGNGHNLWVEGDITVADGAELNLSPAGELVMTGLNSINVNSGGKLVLFGMNVHADISTARFDLNVNNGGTILALETIFRNMGPNGVYLKEGSVLHPDCNFVGCTFQDGVAGGTLLRIDNNQDLTIRNAVFPANTWAGASNVTKSVNSGHLYFVDFTGAFAGEPNDNDPYGLVTWVPVLSASVSATPSTICIGSNALLSAVVSGGMPPYSYLWTPTIGLSDPFSATTFASPATTRTYNVNISDILGSGVDYNITVTVQPVVPASVTIAASANPSPPGSFVLFTATPVNGGTSPAYQWKVNGLNAGTGLSTFTYVPSNGDDVECVMTSNYACASGNPATSNTITMIVMPATISVNGAVSAPLSLCFDASNTITVAGSGNIFRVEPGAGATMIAGVKISYLDGTTVQPGGYMHGYITATHEYCGSLPPAMVAVVNGDGPTANTGNAGSPEIREYTIFIAFPNPTQGAFTIALRDHMPLQPVRITITDLRGKVVADLRHDKGERCTIDLTGRPAGLYVIRLTGDSGTENIKLVVRP